MMSFIVVYSTGTCAPHTRIELIISHIRIILWPNGVVFHDVFFLQMTNSNNALDWLSNTIKRTPCKCRKEALQRMVPSDGWISYFASSLCFLSLRMSTASIHPPVQYGDAGPRIVQHMGKEAPFYASLRTRTPVLKWHDLNTSPQHTILQRSFASLAINALRSVRKPFVLAS